mgnify:FL=1
MDLYFHVFKGLSNNKLTKGLSNNDLTNRDKSEQTCEYELASARIETQTDVTNCK